MPISQSKLEQLLNDAFPGADITITDLAGDNDHYRLEIASEQFRNKSTVEQHRMINNALATELKGPLHALSIKTKAK